MCGCTCGGGWACSGVEMHVSRQMPHPHYLCFAGGGHESYAYARMERPWPTGRSPSVLVMDIQVTPRRKRRTKSSKSAYKQSVMRMEMPIGLLPPS